MVMQAFFLKKPEVFSLCEILLKKLDEKYFPNKNEISFDLIFPFLLSIEEKKIALKMSYELAVYRQLINNYNSSSCTAELFDLFYQSAGYFPISSHDYAYLNSKRCVIDNDIVKSYEYSVDRVFYRFSILMNYKKDIRLHSFTEIANDIKKISAFLLFDDDICDLEKDITNKKDTILTRYIHSNHFNIKTVISAMLFYVKNIHNKELQEFTNSITTIYE
ncbi:hypothetical protein [Tannerella forsythia]|uniref:Uncharacterized protein n=1 Tax=Tannerella forsythia TaxID=28112 RepID=A0A3P1XG55_TANFO|nr:hypothetical protein [Tannerella forsythia]RRD57792.1 hypothetical protein EII40_12575 [Tannerella forsythia]